MSGPVQAGGALEDPVFDEDRLQDKRDVLKPTKLKILQQILATDWGSLSARELAFRNADLEESTIRDHLREMADRERPFVEQLRVDDQHREQGVPWTFYAVTEYGIELLEEVGAYDGISVLYQMYEELDTSELEEIESFEYRPVPDWL